MPKWNKVSQDDDTAKPSKAAPAEPLRFQPESRSQKIEVTVRHWMHEKKELRVVLPKRAKFKHIKRAMAKKLGREDFLGELKLMYNQGGIYTSYKDNHPIGDKRLVLARCPADVIPDGGAIEASLSEGEVSAEDSISPPTRSAADGIDRSQILPDAAANSAAARRVRAGGPLTRKQAISLQLELLEAFRGEDFQRQSIQLEAEKEAGMPQSEFSQRRSELRLSVQRKIIPKYGIEGSSEGVLKMMGLFEPFYRDPEFLELGQEINELLGLSTSVDTWSTVSSQCRKLQDEPRPKARPMAIMPALPGMGMGVGRMGGADLGGMPSVQSFAREDQGMLDIGAMDAKYEPWPPGRGRPFKLYVVGSWNDNEPVAMLWDSGVFTSTITMGADAMEIFQLIENKDWNRTYYPSEPDAQPGDGHYVLGPDDGSEGRSWLIGSPEGTVGKPGDKFDIVVSIDSSASVAVVDWHLSF